jgi:Carbohydrate binding domain (family 11)
MLARMLERALPRRLQLWLTPRRGVLAGLLLVASACSVYSDALLDDASPIVNGGANDGAGRGGVNAGGSSNGGTAGEPDEPAAGGAGDPSEGGGAGAPPDGGTSGGPTAGGGAIAGGGGTAGTAAGGTGGTATGGSPPIGLVDDFEDRNIVLKQVDGRGGVWYLFAVGTGGTSGPKPLAPVALSEAPEELGGYALHVTSSGWDDWSGLGVDFRDTRKVYDASKFTGLRFWARVGKAADYRVQIADATTDKLGGKCNSAANAPNGEKCGDHFFALLTLTTTWKQHTIRFEDLSQDGWGLPGDELDAAHVYGLEVKSQVDVDLWIDQIELF